MSEAVLTDDDRADLHRKMDAEIAKLIGESSKMATENSKLAAETAKLAAETAKINAELRAYPWLPLATTLLGSTGLIGAIVAILIAFHK